MEIGPVEILAADVKHRERLSIDLDGNLLRPGGDLHLGPGRQRGADREDENQRELFHGRHLNKRSGE